MRQGQPQNRQRSRGRGNNNRNNNNNSNSNRNNINRSMESNGPDVRIRGTASHIAEKYQQLARDALSAGDLVAAESYWQHAEHYNRLIAVAQAQQAQQREEQQRVQQQQNAEAGEAGSAERGEGGDANRNRGRRNRNQHRDDRVAEGGADAEVNGEGPQPILEDVPAEVAVKEAEAVVNGSDESATPERKPRQARRPRKKAEEDAPAAAEAKADLPAFISGGADD